jgi:wyosine [tRNA(Phe)-imidazoG37] synthetase (radical SAM superfamily)
VITNGALLYDARLRDALMQTDIVLPSFDAGDQEVFAKINRPVKTIRYQDVVEGLRTFSKVFQGQLWLETMLVGGLNDTDDQLEKIKAQLKTIDYDRLYINVPVRPPAEDHVDVPLPERMKAAVELLGGISIDQLVSEGFYSEEEDPVKAILNIIQRHPMNQYEIRHFLESRGCETIEEVFEDLKADPKIEAVDYKGYCTYRILE